MGDTISTRKGGCFFLLKDTISNVEEYNPKLLRMFRTVEGYHLLCGGYHQCCGGYSVNWGILSVLWKDTIITVPKVPVVSLYSSLPGINGTLQRTEDPPCIDGILHRTGDPPCIDSILHRTVYPHRVLMVSSIELKTPGYWWYPP